MKLTIINAGAGAQLAKTLDITIQTEPISSTVGSVAWLLQQPIKVQFREEEFEDRVYRVAEIHAGNEWECIASHDAVPDDKQTTWLAQSGIHDIPLGLVGPWGPFLPGNPSLTAGAKDLLDRICNEVRLAFRTWLDDRYVSSNVTIRLETKAF